MTIYLTKADMLGIFADYFKRIVVKDAETGEERLFETTVYWEGNMPPETVKEKL